MAELDPPLKNLRVPKEDTPPEPTPEEKNGN
jgi:hypothetical protein